MFEYELLSNKICPTKVAVVGNKRAAQSVVVGLITGLNWTELVEMFIGSHLKKYVHTIFKKKFLWYKNYV